MDLELWVQLATLATLVVGVASAIISVRAYFRQENSQMIRYFLGEYGRIVRSYPRGTRHARLGASLPPVSDEMTEVVLEYLNLCSQEYLMWKQGYLDSRIWAIWRAEMVKTIRSPLYRREWKILASEFDSDPAFQSFVEDIRT